MELEFQIAQLVFVYIYFSMKLQIQPIGTWSTEPNFYTIIHVQDKLLSIGIFEQNSKHTQKHMFIHVL